MGSKIIMFIKGAGQLASKLALELIIKGFKYEDLRELIVKETGYKTEQELEYFEDKLYEKLEKYSLYVWAKDIKTNEEYYYHSVKEMAEDTGMTESCINGSIYSLHLANSMFVVEKRYFNSKDICKNKEELFKKKIGKVKVREYYTKGGKHLSNPLKITDTFTNKIMNYPTGRAFCDEFEIKGYNLSKYILEGYKYKGRYKIENAF